jgi:hypothetical protein
VGRLDVTHCKQTAFTSKDHRPAQKGSLSSRRSTLDGRHLSLRHRLQNPHPLVSCTLRTPVCPSVSVRPSFPCFVDARNGRPRQTLNRPLNRVLSGASHRSSPVLAQEPYPLSSCAFFHIQIHSREAPIVYIDCSAVPTSVRGHAGCSTKCILILLNLNAQCGKQNRSISSGCTHTEPSLA